MGFQSGHPVCMLYVAYLWCLILKFVNEEIVDGSVTWLSLSTVFGHGIFRYLSLRISPVILTEYQLPQLRCKGLNNSLPKTTTILDADDWIYFNNGMFVVFGKES